MSHFDKIVKLPEGFVIVASTSNSEFAGIAHQTKPIYGTCCSVPGFRARAIQIGIKSFWLTICHPGVQFHPELEHVS